MPTYICSYFGCWLIGLVLFTMCQLYQTLLVMLKIIEQLGAEVSWIGNHSVMICASNITSRVPDRLASKIRGSICLMETIIARNGHISMPHPGGCNIDNRPIDLHLK